MNGAASTDGAVVRSLTVLQMFLWHLGFHGAELRALVNFFTSHPFAMHRLVFLVTHHRDVLAYVQQVAIRLGF